MQPERRPAASVEPLDQVAQALALDPGLGADHRSAVASDHHVEADAVALIEGAFGGGEREAEVGSAGRDDLAAVVGLDGIGPIRRVGARIGRLLHQGGADAGEEQQGEGHGVLGARRRGPEVKPAAGGASAAPSVAPTGATARVFRWPRRVGRPFSGRRT